MRHAAAPAIQLPDQHGLEAAQPRVAQQPIELRATVRGPAEAGIHVLSKYLPALPLDVLAQFSKLHLATLVRSTHPGVDGHDHVTMSALTGRKVNVQDDAENGLKAFEKPLKNDRCAHGTHTDG